MKFAVTSNPLAPNVPAALSAACDSLGIEHVIIPLDQLTASFEAGGPLPDPAALELSHLSPSLLYWQPAAAVALRVIQRRTRCLNSVEATETADDKALTALALADKGVAQVPTRIVPPGMPAHAEAFPVVLKRAHGAQGLWVRLARGPSELERAEQQLRAEGPGTLLLQPAVGLVLGETVRVVIVAGRARAWTLRRAQGQEWRSNVARGAAQQPTELTELERVVAEKAAGALGLGFAGVDLARTAEGPLVIEVNSCPDFTSMKAHVDVDIARLVVQETVALPPPQPA